MIGAFSVQSNYLHILLLGRFVNGIGSSIVACIPESWLISEALKNKSNDTDKIDNYSKYLSDIFGLVRYFIIANALGLMRIFTV